MEKLDKLKELYIIAEMSYQKKFGQDENIFPKDWYKNENYLLKIKLIAQAIKNNKKIESIQLHKR